MLDLTYNIKYSDVDKNNIIKPTAILEFLEDVASKDANNTDIGYNIIAEKNYGWFILKYAIEFSNYPKNTSILKLQTNSRGANRLFAFRDFKISDTNNNVIGKVTSTWGLIDMNTKELLNPLEVFNNSIQKFEKRENDLNYKKIPIIENFTYQKNFEISYYDVDVNCHVNNSRYLNWALSTLPINFIENKKVKRIDINYKKEITLGNEVTSQVCIDGDLTFHKLINSNSQDILCIMQIEWEN